MDSINHRTEKDRRTFLKAAVRCGGALAVSTLASRLGAQGTVDWSKFIGIQLTVVRDQMLKDVEATLVQLAAIGYRYVNPVGFSGLDAKAYREMLDRHGLSAPQIDLGFSTAAGMEEDLEACQILGIKYAEPAVVGTAQRGSARGGAATDPYRGAPGGLRRPATPPPQTEEEAKRAAAEYNTYGKTARKFGIKVIFHNHIEHFELLTGSKSTFFDVFLSETDPELVGMELDLGYTAIAGRNIPEAIRQYPGRFPVWDVRDVFGIKTADANPAATGDPIGGAHRCDDRSAEVDFKTIFAGAETAGLKHFFVLQDNAASWGDSMAVAKVSWQNLTKIFAPGAPQ